MASVDDGPRINVGFQLTTAVSLFVHTKNM